MEREWRHLGRELAAARKRLGRTQVDVADALGVSRTPIQAIERGGPFDKITGTIREYARLVGWADGSIEAVLAGDSPKTAPPEPPDAVLAGDLPLRIVEEIGEGQLLDTDVIELPGSGARMTVVVRGAPNATPAEIKRDLLAWRRAQRHLQELGEDEDEPEDQPPVADQA